MQGWDQIKEDNDIPAEGDICQFCGIREAVDQHPRFRTRKRCESLHIGSVQEEE